MGYSQTSNNDHLSSMATFLVESPYIDSCFNTSLQSGAPNENIV